MGRIVITGRARRGIAEGHPWIYADAIAEGEGEPGELVPVFDPNQEPVGWGLLSTRSKIAVRLVTRSPEQPNRDFWLERVRAAVEHRERCGLLAPDGACRLVFGDADGLPGLVVDRYADVLVLQSGCQASDRMLPFLLELLREVVPFPVGAVLDRSDSSVRRLEGLEPRVEWIEGERNEPVVVHEAPGPGGAALAYEVAPLEGHKTGHYLDQVENRVRAAEQAAGRRVLDAFSYDGLFGIRAALAGAESVVCLDQSEPAGERLRRNAERNGVADRVSFAKANAMNALRERAGAGERYGLVVLDPPAFARNRREAAGAARGYRELNRRGIDLTEPGGVLVTASCSYNLRRDDFLSIVGEAAHSAGREARAFAVTGAAADHPVHLSLSETEYLKCAFVRL